MSCISKLKMSLVCGTAAAVMLYAAFPYQLSRSIFFPSFILSACSEPCEDEDVEYGFAIFDLIKKIFG